MRQLELIGQIDFDAYVVNLIAFDRIKIGIVNNFKANACDYQLDVVTIKYQGNVGIRLIFKTVLLKGF